MIQHHRSTACSPQSSSKSGKLRCFRHGSKKLPSLALVKLQDLWERDHLVTQVQLLAQWGLLTACFGTTQVLIYSPLMGPFSPSSQDKISKQSLLRHYCPKKHLLFSQSALAGQEQSLFPLPCTRYLMPEPLPVSWASFFSFLHIYC